MGSCHNHWVERQDAPAQGGVLVLQACLFCRYFPHQGALPAHLSDLWGSKVHRRWGSPAACPGWDGDHRCSKQGSSSSSSASSTDVQQQMRAPLGTCKEAADACGVQGADLVVAHPGPGAGGSLRHQHQKYSATTRNARAVMLRTIAAAMRTAAVMRSRYVNCLNYFS